MRVSLLSLAAAAVVVAGCGTTTKTSRENSRAAVAPDSGLVLRVDGESVVLGQATSTPLSLPAFASRVQQLASAGRDQDANRFVQTYPDLAEQAVLSPEIGLSMQRTIAAWLDGIAAPKRGGWGQLVADRSSNARRYAAWKKQRGAAWSAFRRGAFAEVADQKLAAPADGPTPWPAVDAARMSATAMLAASRPADAATRFEQVAQRAAEWDTRVAAKAHLFASLSYKLAGNKDAAARARANAVGLVSLSSVHDPMVLRLLLETHASANPSTDAFSRRQVRARLGRVELQRGSPQAALLAWRAAETEPGAIPALNTLRLGQAEALIALGQDEPAVAMLVGLARTNVRPKALAMLGLIQMRRGQADIALAVFREAVTSTTAQANPDVYADAGLALLSVGEKKAGLALLDKARAAYRARGDRDAVRRTLRNQLEYAEAVGDDSVLRRTRKDLARLGAAQ